jgi:hypothetical protein
LRLPVVKPVDRNNRMGCRENRRRWGPIAALLLLIFLQAGTVPPAGAQATSAPIYNPANGHWYQVVRAPRPLNWYEARAAAEALTFAGYRGHLATFTSANENQFLVGSVVNGAPYGEQWWLGGYQDKSAPDYREPAGGWRWVTGEPFGFSNWIEGEPNDNGNGYGGEDALQLQQERGNRWNDLPGQFLLSGYIVEYEPLPFPIAAVVQIVPQALGGGITAAGQLTFTSPVGPGGAVLTLFSSNPAVAVPPATLAVPAGATAAFFPVVTFPVAVPTTVIISVSGYGVAATASLQVLPTSVGFPPGNLLINGSFEEPRVSSGLDITVGPGGLPGWRMLRGTVNVNSSPLWQPAPGEGTQSLDLVGSPGAATIEQTIATEPGREYVFSGWISHNAENPVAPEGRANVLLNGQFFVQLFHRDPATTHADMRWLRFSYRFRASAYATTLTLEDVTNTWDAGGGAFLDGLTVIPADASFPSPTPGTPASLAVRLISATQVELSWVDTSSDETGFEIQRRTVAGDWVSVAQVAANSTRFTDYGVSPGTTYTYRVRAQNAQGPSAWSNEASVTTLVP